MDELELQHPDGGVHKRDELFDALMAVCEVDTDGITARARGSYNKSLRELRNVRATPAEVRARGEMYRVLYPYSGPLTPAKLCHRWAELKPKGERKLVCPDHGPGRCYFMFGTGWSHQGDAK